MWVEIVALDHELEQLSTMPFALLPFPDLQLNNNSHRKTIDILSFEKKYVVTSEVLPMMLLWHRKVVQTSNFLS
jgi:hypothetical protein